MKQISSQKGFTIIETLVAVTILMIAIAGPLTIAFKSYSSAVIAHDQITASYLAQDAMEYLKNVRDNNLLQGDVSMLRGFDDCIQTNQCTVDTLTGDIGHGNAKLFKLSASDGGYSHSSNSFPTPFSRSFYLSNIQGAAGAPSEAKITVVVTWSNGTVANQVLYENEIFNAIK